jgi:phenylpropionate dioxygenase-like ring-hydroxylating dioxygenase large terminal subunit
MIPFMREKTLWHPVALGSAVAPGPVPATLLEQPLVLWRDATGRLQAWDDRCPHRGAQLSLGRVHGDRLECAYHGWQFDGQGQCQRVPALPGFTPPMGHCARAFEATEAHGLVWVRLARPEGPDSAPPAFDDAGLRGLNCGPYDVATSAPRVVENFLDMAHFSFVHEHWLGSREFTEIEHYQVQDTEQGVRATGCKAWQPRSNLHSIAPAQVEYSYEVTAPYAAVLGKVPEAGSTQVAGWREAIALFICPVTPDRSRVWFRLAVADFQTSDEQLLAFQHTIFTQDQPVLESQLPKRLPLDLRAELHCEADRLSSAYRRYLQRLGITFGTC